MIDAARQFTAWRSTWRETVGDFRDRQISRHRARAHRHHDAMDVHGGKGICLGRISWRAITSRRRSASLWKREYPDAQPDHLRAGGDPLTSLRPERDCGGARPEPPARAASVRRSCSGIQFALGTRRAASFRAVRRARIPAPRATKPAATTAIDAVSPHHSPEPDVGWRYWRSLKRREKIARLGDVAEHAVSCSAALKRFEDDTSCRGSCRCCIGRYRTRWYQTQQAVDGVIRNFPMPWYADVERADFPLGMRLSPPATTSATKSPRC